MEIGAVRALKEELAETLIMEAVERNVRSFGIAPTVSSRVSGAKGAIALGIAAGHAAKDYRLAVRVQRRAIEDDGPMIEAIIGRARGEADVRYIGRVGKQSIPWHQRRRRPMLIGSSTAHVDVTAGTIGAFVTVHSRRATFLLSNNHVLANENLAVRGDVVVQPGPLDGGGPFRDRVGVLHGFVRMKKRANFVDAAIARLDADVSFDPRSLNGIGTLNGIATQPLEPGDIVHKVGRTTGVTIGRVTAIEVDDLVIDYDIGLLSFDRQIEIEGAHDEAFSAGGDSGSIIVDSGMNARALLFAGGDHGGSNGKGLTYANPIGFVFDAMRLALVI